MTSCVAYPPVAGPPRTFFFFFNDTATTEIYTLSLHDALPIYPSLEQAAMSLGATRWRALWHVTLPMVRPRSEEHTSELQSRPHLVCRLLLEKKKNHPTPPDDLPRQRPVLTIPPLTHPHRHSDL